MKPPGEACANAVDIFASNITLFMTGQSNPSQSEEGAEPQNGPDTPEATGNTEPEIAAPEVEETVAPEAEETAAPAQDNGVVRLCSDF